MRWTDEGTGGQINSECRSLNHSPLFFNSLQNRLISIKPRDRTSGLVNDISIAFHLDFKEVKKKSAIQHLFILQ